MAHALLIKNTRRFHPSLGDGIAPPLGLMCIIAFAREKRPGKDRFTLVDERSHPKTEEEWLSYIDELRPDCIGFSTSSVESDQLEVLVPLFKERFPHIPLILGGPHASSVGAKLLKTLPADFVVTGEGELPFVSLLEMVDAKLPHPDHPVSGLSYLDDEGNIVNSPRHQVLLDVEELPMPAWDMVDFRYFPHYLRMTPFNIRQPYAPLVTSRGCPYNCIYCHNIFAKKFRTASANKIVNEIEHLIDEYGVHEFEIWDDIFNLDKQRVLDVCNEIHRRGLKTAFTFPNGVRSDVLDREVLEALASVGTYHMAFAIETASPRIQKLARKNLDLKKAKENMQIATDLGILTWGFFMLGFPTETRKELWRTVFFARFAPLHGCYFFQVVPHDGTDLAREYEPTWNIKQTHVYPDYLYGSGSMSEVSPWELRVIQAAAYLLFLSSPKRMWKLIKWRETWQDHIPETIEHIIEYVVTDNAKRVYDDTIDVFSKVFKRFRKSSTGSDRSHAH